MKNISPFLELKDRMCSHLNYFDHGVAASIVWFGYIAGLLEHGIITPHEHDQLNACLSHYPEAEMQALFLGVDNE